MRFRLILPAVLAVTALGLSGCGASPKPGKSLATYDGGSVSEADFRKAVEGLPKRIRGIAVRQRKEFMESYITEKLLLVEAERRGIQHLQDVENLLRQARQKILVAKLIELEIESKVKVTDADAKAFYDAHKDEYMSPFRIRASHILLRSREEAEAVLAKLKAGEDFADLAKRYSLDPTGPKGGDLGFFEKGQLILEIEEAAFSMQKDQVSEIIQTNFGFHILKVTDIAKPQIREFDSVKREVIEKLTVDEKTKHFTELTDSLKGKAKISIDEKSLDALNFPQVAADDAAAAAAQNAPPAVKPAAPKPAPAS